jgi:hypothetical protein
MHYKWNLDGISLDTLIMCDLTAGARDNVTVHFVVVVILREMQYVSNHRGENGHKFADVLL